MVMNDYKTSALVTTPSYAGQLARGELEQSLGIPVKVRLVEPGTMAKYSDRFAQIVDERTNG
jgi:phenylacetate-coenzyme A ligase PaaK-like adenylate-forming protein